MRLPAISPAMRCRSASQARVSIAGPPSSISASRPPMKRAEGTGVPKASTFTRQSRASASEARLTCASGGKVRMATNQVPVESMVQARAPISGYLRAASRAALLSWMPHSTTQSFGRPQRTRQASDIGPRISPAARRGARRSAQPRACASGEGRDSSGRHRSLWQPRLVTSVAAMPHSSQDQYCGQVRICASRARRALVSSSQKSCAPRLSPPGRQGEPVMSKGSRAAR